MIPPLLRLAFVQGPRDGDSLEYKPGSTIRIGRLVRGNEIAIKDAGISTKHLRIVSDSENWIIHDLGSSNGTILNSDTLDPDTPVNLRHGDVIKLGECTSIVVNFVTDVQAQEHKLPPRPRRNTRRLAVADADPDPMESVQEKPTHKGRSSKQDGHELPKRTRASKSRTLEDIAGNEKELEVENEEEVKSRVTRSRKNDKKVGITKEEEEVPEEKKGNSRARKGKKIESVQKLGLNSVKLEVEDTPKGVGISGMKRATRSRQIENACLGLENVKREGTVLEEKDEKRTSRATRSKKNEIGGDSFLELEMVLKQARKSRAKKKKMEQEMEARNDDVEEDKENEKDQKGCSERSDKKPSKSVVEMEARNDNVVEAQKGCNEREFEREGDDGSKRVEQVETELEKSAVGEEDLNCTVREADGETENLQDAIEEERDCKSEEEKVEQESSNKNVEKVEVDLEKMTLEEWSAVMKVQLRKQIVDETEKMIEAMRAKSLRVHKYIAEEKQAKGKGREGDKGHPLTHHPHFC